MQIDMTFPVARQRKTTRMFLYEGKEEAQFTPEEQFKQDFLLPLLDTALTSVSERFTQIDYFFSLFGFLYSADNRRRQFRRALLMNHVRNWSRHWETLTVRT